MGKSRESQLGQGSKNHGSNLSVFIGRGARASARGTCSGNNSYVLLPATEPSGK